MYQSELLILCNNHPYENPQPGICPSCLRERLSEISATQYSRNNNIFSSSSSPRHDGFYYEYSSVTASSGCVSPVKGQRGHQRMASDIMDSIYMKIRGNISGGLKKSRSMAFTASRNNNTNNVGMMKDIGNHDQVKKTKKKGGFWNKLRLLGLSTGKKAKV